MKTIIASVVALASVQAISAPSESLVVRTESGPVRGVVADDVLSFEGIPFAAPPVGPLRWRPPAAPATWVAPRDASKFGAKCPQPEFPPPLGSAEPSGEDCLFLNVWRPATTKSRKLPVMVWIHGGGFIQGSGSHPLYEGTALARRGVVVVTLNYRLGALGYLAHPALTKEQANGSLGNYGTLDQIAALRWVQRNIANLGGDPKNVTLFGDSAGGGVVTMLMTSPLTRGLFAKAISQSGGGTAVFPPVHGVATSGEATGLAWAKSLGAGPDATAEDLRQLPLTAIGKAPFFSYPNIDGRTLLRSPGDAFLRGEQARIPFLVGANSFESSLPIFNAQVARMTIGAEYDRLVDDYAGRGFGRTKAESIVLSQLFMVQPARLLARASARGAAPTFLYFFTQIPSTLRETLPGAPHGGELPYVFGTPGAFLSKWDGADRQVAATMQDYWIRFAATGDPGRGAAARWMQVEARSATALRIGGVTAFSPDDKLADEVERVTTAAAKRAWVR